MGKLLLFAGFFGAVVSSATFAQAGGKSSGGTDFPSQVGGWRFGATKAQAVEVCSRAGGKVSQAASVLLSDGFFCSVVPDPPVALGTPDLIRADTCGVAICELKLFWENLSAEGAWKIAEALGLKYGHESPNEGSVTLAELDRTCRADPSSQKNLVVAWIFSSTNAKGERVGAGAMFYIAVCDNEGRGIDVFLRYENQEALSQRIKRQRANF